MTRGLATESLATFGLVFAGTSACVVEAKTGSLGVTGIGVVFGLAVYAFIIAFGAQMNPAVTFALWRGGRLPGARAAELVAAQFLGALAASLCVSLIFGPVGGLGATRPHFGTGPAFALEFLMTFLLALVVLRAPGHSIAFAAAAVVGLEAIFGGPVSGASMNPARSLAPALVSGSFRGQWIYLFAPMLGAWAASAAHKALGAPPPGPY